MGSGTSAASNKSCRKPLLLRGLHFWTCSPYPEGPGLHVLLEAWLTIIMQSYKTQVVVHLPLHLITP
jgi:hypothetical protein